VRLRAPKESTVVDGPTLMKFRLSLAAVIAMALLSVWLLRRGAESATASGAPGSGEESAGEFGRTGASSGERTGAAATSPTSTAVAPGAQTLDREKRDAIRALIWKSFGQAMPDAAPLPKEAYVLPDLPPWPEGPSDAGGGIEAKYIQEHVRNEFFPVARQCYASLAERVPDAGGTVDLAFNIVGNANIGGVVEQVDVLNKSTLRDPEFVACMRQSFLSVTFPPPEGGGMVSVEYPIQFDPGEESD
jgi:hypothetical protein